MKTYPKKIHFKLRDFLLKQNNTFYNLNSHYSKNSFNEISKIKFNYYGLVYFEYMERKINSSQDGIRQFLLNKFKNVNTDKLFILNKNLHHQFIFILKYLIMISKTNMTKIFVVDIFALNRGSITLTFLISQISKIFRYKKNSSIYFCIWDINDPLILSFILLSLKPIDKIFMFGTSKKEVDFLPHGFFCKPVPLIPNIFQHIESKESIQFYSRSNFFTLPNYKDEHRAKIIGEIKSLSLLNNAQFITQDGYLDSLDYINFLNSHKFHITINSISSPYRKSTLLTETHLTMRNNEILYTGGLLISQKTTLLEELLVPNTDYLPWTDLDDLNQIIRKILSGEIDIFKIAKSGSLKIKKYIEEFEISEI